jgi:enamine deaminase RidA (YjgF/YER057c/UK114 family)
MQSDGTLITGMVGPDDGGMTVQAANEAARHCGLNIISTLKEQLGDLDRVEQVVKVCGFHECMLIFFVTNVNCWYLMKRYLGLSIHTPTSNINTWLWTGVPI